MAVTIRLYDHTPLRFINGANAASDTYIINLYSALTFTSTDATKAAAETGATQLSTANGYTQDTKALTGMAITATGSPANDVKLDADDVSWTASGGDIGPARYALVYNNTDTDKPPVAFIDFGENKTAGSGTPFNITWHTNGIITWSYDLPA